MQNDASQNTQTNNQQVDPASKENNVDVQQNSSQQTTVQSGNVAQAKPNTPQTLDNNDDKAAMMDKVANANDDKAAMMDKVANANDDKAAMMDKVANANDDKAAMMDKVANANDDKAAMMDKVANANDDKAAMMDKVANANDDKAAMMDKVANANDDKAAMMDKVANNSNDKAAMMNKVATMNKEKRKFNPQAVFLSPEDVKGKKKKFSNIFQKRFSSDKIVTARPNALLGNRLPVTRFLGSGGDLIDIADFADKKIVLVILRGFAGGICLACSAQTLALSKSVDKFNDKNAQIILVYPGKAESIPVFTSVLEALEEDFQAPFPIVLDVELELIRQLTIEGSLAKPTSMIVTPDGKIEYVYVGKNITDRPTVKTLLLELDNLSQR
ncbi:peroxiredoxin family protein [Candidatus Uabimicrobium amorphum]|uniref:peroxiredoxin family protein n=2 Tax=Uabimicrobium amorphum TaxID=2596890 RepID=UPI001565706A|nr:redoxin family protein [Candidatus Uabimicrobium amorphum]